MNPSGEKVAKISQNNEKFYWCSDENFSLDFQKKQTVNKCQSSMGTHNNENYLIQSRKSWSTQLSAWLSYRTKNHKKVGKIL